MRSASGVRPRSFRRLRQRLAGAPLRAQHPDVRVRELLRIIHEGCEDARILLEAVRHQHGRIGGEQRKPLIARQLFHLQREDLVGCSESALRGQVGTSIRDRHKPAQFAREFEQRFGIVAGAEDP